MKLYFCLVLVIFLVAQFASGHKIVEKTNEKSIAEQKVALIEMYEALMKDIEDEESNTTTSSSRTKRSATYMTNRANEELSSYTPHKIHDSFYKNNELVYTNKGTFHRNDYNFIILKAFNKKVKAGDKYADSVSPDYCPIHFSAPAECEASARYRTLDGTCNNVNYPTWGAENNEYIRNLPPTVEDQLTSSSSYSKEYTKGYPYKPNAKLISLDFFKSYPSRSVWSNLLVTYGQMIAHDLVKSLNYNSKDIPCDCYQSKHERYRDCILIPIGKYMSMAPSTNPCYPYLRSSPTFVSYNCKIHAREQSNTNTAYLDLSVIYSEYPDTRSYNYGELAYSRNERGEMTHKLIDNRGCQHHSGSRNQNKLYKTADKDAEQNVMLTSLESLYLRNHNKLGRELRQINPHWSDERLFQEARMINIAIHQHITFMEYLPNTIGVKMAQKYDLEPLTWGYSYTYDPKLESQTYNEWATAAFRHHFLVNNEQCVMDRPSGYGSKYSPANANTNPQSQSYGSPYGLRCFDLAQSFLNSTETCHSTDAVLRGQIYQSSYHTRPQMSWVMNHALLNKDDSITVKNIMRGRDHNLRSYVDYREYCGLGRAYSFDDLVDIPPSVRDHLKDLYYDVNNIDLYVGGVAELPVKDGMVGPVFACLIAKQMKRVKKGDRFYYENGNFKASRFTQHQLNAIRTLTLSKLICQNVEMDKIPEWSFLYPDQYSNKEYPCSLWNREFNLEAWREKAYY